ncbi:unnamed protein product, partial [Ectocarpus fasciculatus]
DEEKDGGVWADNEAEAMLGPGDEAKKVCCCCCSLHILNRSDLSAYLLYVHVVFTLLTVPISLPTYCVIVVVVFTLYNRSGLSIYLLFTCCVMMTDPIAIARIRGLHSNLCHREYYIID